MLVGLGFLAYDDFIHKPDRRKKEMKTKQPTRSARNVQIGDRVNVDGKPAKVLAVNQFSILGCRWAGIVLTTTARTLYVLDASPVQVVAA